MFSTCRAGVRTNHAEKNRKHFLVRFLFVCHITNNTKPATPWLCVLNLQLATPCLSFTNVQIGEEACCLFGPILWPLPWELDILSRRICQVRSHVGCVASIKRSLIRLQQERLRFQELK
jgi:hypothetical protein